MNKYRNKSLRKSLAIACLAAAVFISGVRGDFVGAQDTETDPMVSRRPDEPILSRYLRFNRITTEEGLIFVSSTP